MKTQLLAYNDNNVKLEGYYAYDDKNSEKRPAVMVVHDWSGRNVFANQKADRLAELGYVGFAVDMYGQGKLGKTKEEKTALIQPLMGDRAVLAKRILAAFEEVKKLPMVDVNRIAIIGFCFGGLCALDLARTGADIKGAISFHGLLGAASENKPGSIKAKILVLHGYDDPMVTHSDVIKFCDEMTKAKANWEVDMYGNAMHAFANPEANDRDFGTVYDKQADERSWKAMRGF